MARKNVADGVGARESLVNLQGCATWVGEDVSDALAFEGFDEYIGAFSGLVRGESRDEGVWIRGNGGGCGCGGGGDGGRWGPARVGAGGDVEGAAERGGSWGRERERESENGFERRD